MRWVSYIISILLLVEMITTQHSFTVTGMNVTYDHRAVVIDGKRRVLMSGSIHYPRSTPEVRLDLTEFHFKFSFSIYIFFFLM